MQKLWVTLGLMLTLGAASCVPQDPSITGTASRADWLVETWVSQACADTDEILIVRGKVTNTGAARQRIELQDQPILDLVITNTEKTVRWSDGKALTSDLTQLELEPHQSKTIEMQWLVEFGPTIWMETQFIDNPIDSRGPVRAITRVHTSPCGGGFGH